MASRISTYYTFPDSLLIDRNMASFTNPSISAPLQNLLPSTSFKMKAQLSSFFVLLKYFRNIFIFVSTLGRLTSIFKSNRPDLISERSTISNLLVAAITKTFSLVSNPSSYDRIWLIVEFFSLFALSIMKLFSELRLPKASSSSMKIIEGEVYLAFANNYLTFLGPIPTYISQNSAPLQE